MDGPINRNVIDMTDYRTDTGFLALSQIEAYWEALRGNRLMPKRAEIDPRGIESALEYTFILERITTGIARMRIAGSHLSDLMGMEVRGMPLTSFISANGRRQIGDILEEVFQRPSVCEIRLSAEVNRHKPAMDARMILLPLKSDMGDVSRALGCMVANGELGQTPRRFDIVGSKIRPLLMPDAPHQSITGKQPQRSLPLTDKEHPAPKVKHAPDMQINATDKHGKPYLRLIKSD